MFNSENFKKNICMKRYVNLIIIVALVAFASCSDDFLTNASTESAEAGGPATEGAIEANLASVYQILLFDSYAANNYNSIVLMSDLRTNDLYKGGGDAGDQEMLYNLSLLNSSSTSIPNGLWSIYYSGIARANDALIACDNAEGVEEERLNELKSEALFLRAYYTHLLWKLWGNIPYFKSDIAAPYMAPQYKADEIYKFIMEDLDAVVELDALPMSTKGSDAGKVNMAATYMLRARVVMYQKDDTRYATILDEMEKIIASSEYKLVDDFEKMWLREGEFGEESIFEVNHLPGEYGGKTWDSGWHGYGTNLPAFISPNELSGSTVYKGGWGFAPVRTEAYDMYEAGDIRRDASINTFDQSQYVGRFQNTGHFLSKYAARIGYNEPPGDTDLNYENNLRIFRLAETYLNIAELIVMNGVPAKATSAQAALDAIRTRAELGSIPATAANIKLERRKEFFGEGMRFWDIVRWGDGNTLTEDNSEFNSTRTWEDYKKYLPIPLSEIEKTEGEFKLEQNPGYN